MILMPTKKTAKINFGSIGCFVLLKGERTKHKVVLDEHIGNGLPNCVTVIELCSGISSNTTWSNLFEWETVKKSKKIKRYRLGVSRFFPTTHPRKRQRTFFVEKIKLTLNHAFEDADPEFDICSHPKIHTIRGNYNLWKKRIDEVQEGRAVIELFYWAGKPYTKDKNGIGQVVFATLDKDSGCGIQKLEIQDSMINGALKSNDVVMLGEKESVLMSTIAQNDGLSLQDFKDWFKKYDLTEPMVIIYFTNFRY